MLSLEVKIASIIESIAMKLSLVFGAFHYPFSPHDSHLHVSLINGHTSDYYNYSNVISFFVSFFFFFSPSKPSRAVYVV